ncbi:MAG: hypothetical protein ACEY3K_02575 [Wolbachia sp.]
MKDYDNITGPRVTKEPWDHRETKETIETKTPFGDIGSKITKVVFDTMGYQVVKATYDDIGSKVVKVVLGDVGRELTGCTDNFDKCTETLDLL